MLEYGVLGPLQVRRGGLAVVVSAAKPRALLFALLLKADAVVSNDQLVDALWPGEAPGSAAKLVQVYVSQLRVLLGAEAIETISPGYRLPVANGRVDADRFERLAAEGRSALAAGNPELARALAGRALALWRGPALAEVAYMPFAERDAARFEDLRLDCLEDVFDAELALGGHQRVLARLTQFCRDHPMRERARGRLALALYRSGRQAEALDVVVEGRRILRDELGVDPGRELRDLEQRILMQDVMLDMPARAPRDPTPSPLEPSVLVGRHDELKRLVELVARDDVRIVTISGAGGSGKTRVAFELARTAGLAFANGASVIELAAIRDPALVMSAIAAGLGVSESAEEAVDAALVRWLASRELLLVIDNFEHVIDAASQLAHLARQAPRLTMVVTSRRVLHITGEHVFPLQPLPADDAVELFKVRALARDPALPFDADDDDIVVGAICARVDCLPLAVELAAARTSALDPRALLERLSHGVGALGMGPRDAPARQRTLANTLRWSTDLLDRDERQALGRLSVFAGGCSADAAETVCQTDIATISALIDASLIRRTITAPDPRLTMLETVREHCAEFLLAADDRLRAETAHAAYYTARAENTPFKGPHRDEGLRWADTELDNLRTAADRAEAAGDHTTALRVATALYRFWYVRGHFREGRDRIARPLDQGAGDAVLQAMARRALAGLNLLVGDLDEAIAVAQRGVELGSAIGVLESVMGCETVLGLAFSARRDFTVARRHLERSAEVAEQLGSAVDVMIANTNLGDLAMSAGDFPDARRRWQRTLEWNRGRSDTDDTFALLGLGTVARRQGLLGEAAEHFTRAHELAERNGFRQNMAFAALGLAGVASDQSRFDDAARLLRRVDELLAATGGALNNDDVADYHQIRNLVVSAIGAQHLGAH